MDDRDYLDHLTRTTADNVTATITARNDDGTYMVKEIGSRATHRASKANPVDEFSLGARVLISVPDASRTVLGSSAVIISRAPRDQRGLAGSVPIESRETYERPVILSVDPDPLVLERGGAPGEQTVIGRNLTHAATYVRRSEFAADPLVTETDDPDVAPSEVVMTISADSDSPTGLFSLKIGTAAYRDALRILPPGPASLYVVVADIPGSPNTCSLWILHASSLTILHTISVIADVAHGLAYHDGVVYWITRTGAGIGSFVYSIHAVDPFIGTITSTSVLDVGGAVNFVIAPFSAELVVHDGHLLIYAQSGAVTVRGVWRFNLDGSAGARVWTDPTSFQRNGIAIDDSNQLFVAGIAGIVKLSATYVQLASSALIGGRVTVADATHVVLSSTTPVRFIDSGLALANSFSSGASAFGTPVLIGARIFFAQFTTTNLYSASFDGVDVDLVGTLALFGTTHGQYTTATDGVAILYVASDKTVQRRGTVGESLAVSAVLSAVGGATIRQAIVILADELP